jgi:hypothetical protein
MGASGGAFAVPGGAGFGGDVDDAAGGAGGRRGADGPSAFHIGFARAVSSGHSAPRKNRFYCGRYQGLEALYAPDAPPASSFSRDYEFARCFYGLALRWARLAKKGRGPAGGKKKW